MQLQDAIGACGNAAVNGQKAIIVPDHGLGDAAVTQCIKQVHIAALLQAGDFQLHGCLRGKSGKGHAAGTGLQGGFLHLIAAGGTQSQPVALVDGGVDCKGYGDGEAISCLLCGVVHIFKGVLRHGVSSGCGAGQGEEVVVEVLHIGGGVVGEFCFQTVGVDKRVCIVSTHAPQAGGVVIHGVLVAVGQFPDGLLGGGDQLALGQLGNGKSGGIGGGLHGIH